MDNLWVVMVSRQIADSIRQDLESGLFTKATNSTNLLKSFQQNLANICQNTGGHVHTFLPEWMTMQCQPSVVEQVPNLVESFNNQIGHSIACGIGMSFEEAVRAALESESTGHIVLYQEEVKKAEEQELPPNLFDYDSQKVANTDKAKIDKVKYAVAPDFKASAKISEINVQNMVQQLGGNAMQQMQQQMATQQQQAMQAQKKPRDLTEALHGEQIQNRNPYAGEQQKEPEQNKKQPEQPKQQEQEQPESGIEKDEMGESPDDDAHHKLGNALLQIKQEIPQLMDLSEKNPDAFKQTMALIQKLLNFTKKTKKQFKKSEIETLTEDLNKRLKSLPIGTVRNRRKKVLVNGKAVWRSVASGMVKDLSGEPISVKSSNLAAQKGKQAGEK